MSIRPTETGGRVAYGTTPWGDYLVEWDADGNLVSESCVVKDPATPSRGLGDTIEKLTGKLGIKSCGGCKRRRDKLNQAIPYKRKDASE